MSQRTSGESGAARVSLSVVVPAYNEARRLPSTLPQMIAYLRELREAVELVVVDDGSCDGTASVATELGRACGFVRTLRSAHNHGKGAAVRRGVLETRGEHVLFTDADLSAPIEETGKLRAALDAGADVAIGSRRVAGAQIQVRQPWARALAGRVFVRLVSLLLLPGVTDSQCGFKAFRREVARDLFARQRIDGFAFDVELLYLARRLGYRAVEVPIVWRDDPRSHVRLVRDSAALFLDVLRVRVNAWAGRYELRGAPGDSPASGVRRRG